MILPSGTEGLLAFSQWKEFVTFSVEGAKLPPKAGAVKLLLPEEYFFSLIETEKGKKIWKGIFRSQRLVEVENLREEDTLPLFRGGKELKVLVITRCLLIREFENMEEELPLLYHNPCIRRVTELKLGLVVRYTTFNPRRNFLQAMWQFTHKTRGICPPATCGENDCCFLGGVSVPVIIEKKKVC